MGILVTIPFQLFQTLGLLVLMTWKNVAVDVNIYASSPQDAKALVGNHENTEVGNFLRDYLDLDLEPITKDLVEKGAVFQLGGMDADADGEKQKQEGSWSWMGKKLEEGRRLDGMDHYHGDFKRSLEWGDGHGHVH